jgi:hypothetical protein
MALRAKESVPRSDTGSAQWMMIAAIIIVSAAPPRTIRAVLCTCGGASIAGGGRTSGMSGYILHSMQHARDAGQVARCRRSCKRPLWPPAQSAVPISPRLCGGWAAMQRACMVLRDQGLRAKGRCRLAASEQDDGQARSALPFRTGACRRWLGGALGALSDASGSAMTVAERHDERIVQPALCLLCNCCGSGVF